MKALAAILLVCLSLTAGCAHGPPRETGVFLKPDLVELSRTNPIVRLDLRYATTNNFMGRPMYRQARAFLQRPAMEALTRAARTLEAEGFGLVIFDAYRPWSVTKAFWDAATEEQRRIEFVANPRKGSRHNRGCAVDLSLFVLKTGREVEMPSGYDEFTERAYPDYKGGPVEARILRDKLRRAMENEGFAVYKAEWWHFDFGGWQKYPILNLPFEDLRR